MRSIDHPNVVRVYEVAKLHDERPYFAMQRLDGGNLREHLRRGGPLGVVQAVELAQQALGGLAAAHARRLIHRDVKPSNLFLTHDGVLKVLDFGIARHLDPGQCELLTEPGMVMGTLRYMAPEQLRGGDADARTDVYGVALVLWELIARRHPFDAMADASSSVMTRLHRPAPMLGPWSGVPLPGRLEQTLARALAIEPCDRFESAESFAEALGEDVGERGRSIERATHRRRAGRPVSLTFSNHARSAEEHRSRGAPDAGAHANVCAIRVAFAAHAVGVVLSACAVLLALAAAFAATRRPGTRPEPGREAATLQQVCGGPSATSARGSIGVRAQGR
jgi:serine/threonine protein kinase